MSLAEREPPDRSPIPIATYPRIEERELEAGERNQPLDVGTLRAVAFAVCEGRHHAREWKEARSAAGCQRRR